LLTGVVCGLAVGILMPFRGIPSLAGILPRIQKRLTILSLLAYLLFTGITVIQMVRTDFMLFGPL
jgi:hypothetical protein